MGALEQPGRGPADDGEGSAARRFARVFLDRDLEAVPARASARAGTADPLEHSGSRIGVSGAPLVGHFGTYGAHVARELDAILPALVSRVSEVRLALIGAGGAAFLTRLARLAPAVAARAWAPDRLEPDDVAAALRACAVLVLPYTDGITTRRPSGLAG